MDGASAKLQQLKQLLDAGLIDKSDFDEGKKKILNQFITGNIEDELSNLKNRFKIVENDIEQLKTTDLDSTLQSLTLSPGTKKKSKKPTTQPAKPKGIVKENKAKAKVKAKTKSKAKKPKKDIAESQFPNCVIKTVFLKKSNTESMIGLLTAFNIESKFSFITESSIERCNFTSSQIPTGPCDVTVGPHTITVTHNVVLRCHYLDPINNRFISFQSNCYVVKSISPLLLGSDANQYNGVAISGVGVGGVSGGVGGVSGVVELLVGQFDIENNLRLFKALFPKNMKKVSLETIVETTSGDVNM